MTETENTALGSAAIKDIHALALTGANPYPHPAGGYAVIVPEGYHVERLAEKPEEFIAAAPIFDLAESFTHYVNDFKQDSTRILASIDSAVMTAHLDYHLRGAVPGKLAHTAQLKLRHSTEFLAWTGKNGRAQQQVEFAEFIEERMDDIIAPAAADLLEMVENFTENRTVSFQSKVKRTNGNIVVSYQDVDDPKATGNTKIPERIRLSLAVYEGEPRQEIEAFLRTDTKNGNLTVTVKLIKIDQLKRAAFRAVCEKIGAELGILVGHGALGESAGYAPAAPQRAGRY